MTDIALETQPVEIPVPLEPHSHEHGDHDHDHEHGPDHSHDDHDDKSAYMPQPVPMGIQMVVVPMMDGSDRIQVIFTSVNGQWVTFFEREFAIEHAQNLMRLAYSPPVSVEDESAPAPDA